MKQLTIYKKHGYTWNLADRHENIALFRCGQFWEVVKIQSHHGREIHGKHFPAAEYPPSSAEWGKNGWSFTNASDARNKYFHLIASLPIPVAAHDRQARFDSAEGEDSENGATMPQIET